MSDRPKTCSEWGEKPFLPGEWDASLTPSPKEMQEARGRRAAEWELLERRLERIEEAYRKAKAEEVPRGEDCED